VFLLLIYHDSTKICGGELETYIYALLMSTLAQVEWPGLSPERFKKEALVGIEQEVSWAAEPVWKFQGEKKRCYIRIKVRLRRFPVKNVCRGKEVRITYSECVSVTLVILHAMLVRRFILSSMACAAAQYFSTLSHKRHYFR